MTTKETYESLVRDIENSSVLAVAGIVHMIDVQEGRIYLTDIRNGNDMIIYHDTGFVFEKLGDRVYRFAACIINLY